MDIMQLVAAAIAFINQVSLNGTASKTILSNPEALQKICENIIVPNVEFRQSGACDDNELQ